MYLPPGRNFMSVMYCVSWSISVFVIRCSHTSLTSTPDRSAQVSQLSCRYFRENVFCKFVSECHVCPQSSLPQLPSLSLVAFANSSMRVRPHTVGPCGHEPRLALGVFHHSAIDHPMNLVDNVSLPFVASRQISALAWSSSPCPRTSCQQSCSSSPR